jgi:hypothetical protein
MGKSALTWKWFNDIAPIEMMPLAGRMWWSFYESDAYFDNFILSALAYVSHRPKEQIQQLPPHEREEELLNVLDSRPFLLVMDGLERILIAYARMDAARFADDDLDEKTANYIASKLGLPESATQSFVGQYGLRKTADLRAGAFLRKLTRVRASRILISTRLYPADLQTSTGHTVPGCVSMFLTGLSNDDALNLWRDFGVTGSREALLPLFNTFQNYPLLINILAGKIAHYHRAPYDFERWRKDNPRFNPFSLPLVQIKSHILSFALQGLSRPERKVLHVIAAYRTPATYDSLTVLLIEIGQELRDEQELDVTLTSLEDRGLLGWDRRSNRYDLHPVVRGLIWSMIGDDEKKHIYENMRRYFSSLPEIDPSQVERLEDLTSAVELYNTLISLERYAEAFAVYRNRISFPMQHRLGTIRQQSELLEMLAAEGENGSSRLEHPEDRTFIRNALGEMYDFNGSPGLSLPIFRQIIEDNQNERSILRTAFWYLSIGLIVCGQLREGEIVARRSLRASRQPPADPCWEAESLAALAYGLSARAEFDDAERALSFALHLSENAGYFRMRRIVYAFWAQHYLNRGNPERALRSANLGWELCQSQSYQRDFIHLGRLQGLANLALGNIVLAKEQLLQAIARARAIGNLEEGVPASIALAELERRQGNAAAARELLDDILEPVERGPYPIYHTDALNLLAQLERDSANLEAAADMALKAYRMAWCDGLPFTYAKGLREAAAHLKRLGVEEPVCVPIVDAPPIPKVEI